MNAHRRRNARRAASCALTVLLIGAVWLPVALTVLYSIESPHVMQEYSAAVSSNAYGMSLPLKLAPTSFSLAQYVNILLEEVAFLRFYLNSAVYSLLITAGQITLGVLAAYALSCFKLPFRNAVFFVYLAMMVLPFQVTMVPNYLLMRTLNLLDTPYALILPGIVAPLATFLLRQYMLTVPHALLEAGTIDGANSFRILSAVVMPIALPALCAAAMLCFADAWNMVEQPLIYLRNAALYPLSLAMLTEGQSNASFAIATLYMAPLVLLFLYFQEDIVRGIQTGDLK